MERRLKLPEETPENDWDRHCLGDLAFLIHMYPVQISFAIACT